MKKARIVLSAVALFAVVGGALAFKASRQPASFFSNTTTTTIGGAQTTICTLPVQAALTTEDQGLGSTIVSYSVVAKTNASCPARTLYFAE
ncbi:hypothetical protein [Chitinophaga sp. S165]|uniref:hypothetical protein n=1 Tax=Chitinophaga sp. S165 TaxID=2135462 RepID=UPI000D712417|nr:hypothetical protein [Chitinophaga sp. S165]PWV45797.1 hypothetical protein C7475_11214 [Chitinophaga sp. S165]